MEKNKILKYKWIKDYLVDDVSSSEKENNLENQTPRQSLNHEYSV